jgi:hypothetical protein
MTTVRTEAFELAYKFVTETNSNIFLTGKAGTGKTTFLKYLKENMPKNMAVAAPTGVAAINAGGVTLHSMFQLPFGPYIPENRQTLLGFDKRTLLSRTHFNSNKIEFFHNLELLVIDEVSMVAAYIIDAIDAILRSVRHKNIPFGGVQVLFIGDLYQLQPVVKKEEWELLKNYYSSIFFFDSHVLRDNTPVMIELKEIFRQTDESFINILNGVRDNNLTHEHLRELNQRMQPDFESQDGDGYIMLTTHNNQANRINEIKLNRLSSAPLTFSATIEGEFPDHMIPAEKDLLLKKNAQVMFIKNDLDEKKFFNGKIGVITEISDEKIVVESDGVEINVRKHDWENISYSIDPATKQIEETLIGRFTQYPLRLAWAITIHKSQGLTFDKLVVDAENAFVNGQVYVALSRATTLQGLILTSQVNDRFLGAHTELKKWQENNYNENLLASRFKEARQSFMKQVLFNVFSFDQFRNLLKSLKKEIEENKYDADVHKWLMELSDKYHSIAEVSKKFREQLQTLWIENTDDDINEKLNSRVKDASVYFSTQLGEWEKSFFSHPIKISSRKSAKKIDKLLKDLNESISHSLTKIKICRNGFQFNELAAWKKSIPKRNEIKSTYQASHKKEEIKSEKNSELYDQLIELREEIANEKELPLFLIFSNQTIRNCCELLPGDKQTLLAVDGFGKKKIEDYGDEVLRVIKEYCEENSINLNYLNENDLRNLEFNKSFSVTPTVQQTLDLFLSGKNISEICLERKLASSTIENHLATGIKHNLVKIENVLPREEIESIASLFSNNTFELKTVREKSKTDISYSRLRMVQAWLIASRVKSDA